MASVSKRDNLCVSWKGLSRHRWCSSSLVHPTHYAHVASRLRCVENSQWFGAFKFFSVLIFCLRNHSDSNPCIFLRNYFWIVMQMTPSFSWASLDTCHTFLIKIQPTSLVQSPVSSTRRTVSSAPVRHTRLNGRRFASCCVIENYEREHPPPYLCFVQYNFRFALALLLSCNVKAFKELRSLIFKPVTVYYLGKCCKSFDAWPQQLKCLVRTNLRSVRTDYVQTFIESLVI